MSVLSVAVAKALPYFGSGVVFGGAAVYVLVDYVDKRRKAKNGGAG